MTTENVKEDAVAPSALIDVLERKKPTLQEFIEAVAKIKLYPCQQRIVQAIERGEKFHFARREGKTEFYKLMRQYDEEFKKWCANIKVTGSL